MTIRQMHKNRGSAMLMVVGLLTILALLGGTFLIIARLERKQAVALESQPDPSGFAKSMAKMVQVRLLEDMYISSSGTAPYSDTTSSVTSYNWRRYIDCPPNNNHAGQDFWLASMEPIEISPTVSQWPQLSGLLGDDDRINITTNMSTQYDSKNLISGLFQNGATTPLFYFDSDGDGILDAYVSNLDVTMLNGTNYTAAIRIIDLSGLINVNTAGEMDITWSGQIIPGLVDMKGLIVSATGANTKYGLLNSTTSQNGRFGTYTFTGVAGNGTPDQLNQTSLDDYYNNCATHVLSPATGYLPYALSDETYLRWLSTSEPLDTGRIFTNTTGITSHVDGDSAKPLLRSLLTTYNCSRSLLRHPITVYTNPANPADTTTTSTTTQLDWETYWENVRAATIAGSSVQQYLDNIYRVLLTPLGGITGSIPDATRKKIAHLVANTWAYQYYDPSYSAGPWKAWYTKEFQYTPADPALTTPVIVWGATPQPIISEVYGCRLRTSSGSDDDPATPAIDERTLHSAEFYAIEIMNPSWIAELDLTHFQINAVGGTTPITNLSTACNGKATLAPRETVTLYRVVSGSEINDSSDTLHTIDRPATPGGTPPSEFLSGGENPYDCSTYDFTDFTAGTTVTEIRLERVVGSANLIVDNYTLTSLGLSATPSDTTPFICRNQRRDTGDDSSGSAVRPYRSLPKEYATQTFSLTFTPPGSTVAGQLPTIKIEPAQLTEIRNHKLGVELNNMTAPSVSLDGYDVYWPNTNRTITSLPQLANITLAGAENDGSYQTLPEVLEADFKNPLYGTANPSFMDFMLDPTNANFNVAANTSYPNVPWATLVGELFRFLPADDTRENISNTPTRIYGKININTAPDSVIKRLPWAIDLDNSRTFTATTEQLANTTLFPAVPLDSIIDYISGYKNNDATSVPARTSMVAHIRTGADYVGYLTPGELFVPLLSYFESTAAPVGLSANVIAAGYPINSPQYRVIRNSFLDSASNLITVNSDVYAAYITIGIKPIGETALTNSWRYLAVIDRSNCRTNNDTPEIMLMTPIE